MLLWFNVNLSRRPLERWCVSGLIALERGLQLPQGDTLKLVDGVETSPFSSSTSRQRPRPWVQSTYTPLSPLPGETSMIQDLHLLWVCSLCRLSVQFPLTYKHTMWQGGTSLSVLNYLPLNLANMQVYVGSQHLNYHASCRRLPVPSLPPPSPPTCLHPFLCHPHPSCRDFYCFISMLHVTWRPLREPSNHNAFWQMSTWWGNDGGLPHQPASLDVVLRHVEHPLEWKK